MTDDAVNGAGARYFESLCIMVVVLLVGVAIGMGADIKEPDPTTIGRDANNCAWQITAQGNLVPVLRPDGTQDCAQAPTAVPYIWEEE